MFSCLRVENPNALYKGQKLTIAVSKKTTERIKNTMLVVPVILLVKNNIAMIMAMTMRMILSTVPILGFINFVLEHKGLTYPQPTRLLLLHKGNFISAQLYHALGFELF